MKVKFGNGITRECAPPLEQKLFRHTDGVPVSAGWILLLKLTGGITSAEIDSILTADNTEVLEFLSDNEETLFTLVGYGKITSSIIHYSEEAAETYAEVQLTKGV